MGAFWALPLHSGAAHRRARDEGQRDITPRRGGGRDRRVLADHGLQLPEDWRGRRVPVSGKAETRRPALRGEVMDKAVADFSWPLAGFPSQGGEQVGSVLI